MDGRRRPSQTPHLNDNRPRIREPELDMRRSTEGSEAGIMMRIIEVIRKLVSDNRQTVAPMRSIARELEESWPAGDW